jgi:hypothetical protein
MPTATEINESQVDGGAGVEELVLVLSKTKVVKSIGLPERFAVDRQFSAHGRTGKKPAVAALTAVRQVQSDFAK